MPETQYVGVLSSGNVVGDSRPAYFVNDLQCRGVFVCC
jgi:hypothetical protein